MPIGVARAAPPGDQVIGVARSGPVVSRPGEMPAPGGGLPLGIGKNIHRADLRNGEETEWPVVGNAARLPGQQMMPSAGVLGSPKMEELTTDYLKSLPPKPGAAPVPIPGMSNIGNAAQGDTQAHAAWLQEQMARLMPKASPMENYLRNSSPPISISYGNYGPGEMLPGDVYQNSRALSQAGRGGAGSGVGATNFSASGQVSGQEPARRSGTWYDTPFGFLPNLPNADMMQYQREDEGRKQLMAGLMEAAKAFTPALQTHGAMVDAQARMQAEFGQARAAREIANGAFLEAMKTTGDYEAAQRASQQAYDNYLAMNGGTTTPAAPGQQPTNSGNGTNPPMKPTNLGGGQPPRMPPPPGFTDAAVKKFLSDAGVLNAEGKLAHPDLNALQLAESLHGNTAIAERGAPGLARGMLDAGMAPEKMVKAIEQGMIHLANEGTFGGSTALLRGGDAGATPPEPAALGEYQITPTYSDPSKYAPFGAGPRTHNGWTIRGPGVESWYPVGGNLRSPYFDLTPTLRDQTKSDYRARGQSLGVLRAAIQAEINRRAAATQQMMQSR